MNQLTFSSYVNLVSRIFTISTFSFALATQAGAEPLKIDIQPLNHGEQKFTLSNPSFTVNNDDTPFGVNLSKVTVINKSEGVELNSNALSAQLQKYLQQPLSPKLIAEIRTAITLYFGFIDRPFVSVIIPPQEISGGELTVEYIPFKVGTKTVEGNDWTPAQHILDGIHINAGDEIDSDQLIEDLNWLNLNPYRNLTAVFEPGAKAGTTNIILRADEEKPWSVWTGFDTPGTKIANSQRIYLGFDRANIPFLNHQIGYQITLSPSALNNFSFLNLNKKDGYIAHSLSYFAPIEYSNGARHKVKFQASFAQSFSTGVPFAQENNSMQFYGEYAVPLPLVGTVRSEAYGALDVKSQKNDTLFGGVVATSKSLDIVQFIAGLRGSFTTPIGIDHARAPCKKCDLGHGNFNVRLVGSPGGIGANNSNAAFVASSTNPAAKARYAYIYGQVDHTNPIWANFVWYNKLAFQSSFSLLPNVEQFALGGANSVRGYLPAEAAGENGFSFTSQLYTPPVTFSGEFDQLQDRLRFFGFVDTGFVQSKTKNTSTQLLSTGAGINYKISEGFNGTLTLSRALKAGPVTNAGDTQVSFGFRMNF